MFSDIVWVSLRNNDLIRYVEDIFSYLHIYTSKMRVLTEFSLILIILVSIMLSALFSMIGLSTPGWFFHEYRHLFCDQCSKAPSILSVISIMLLIICIILLILLLIKIINENHVIFIRCLIPFLLFLTNIFLLTSLASYLNFVNSTHGYSYYLTIIAFLFAYFASLLAVFWLAHGGLISKTYSIEILLDK